ncbi:MAG: hypothetical protein IT355_11250 [Gemmatimonadaceae bacterium]|nr:hypothetical protein [Gemmatimonadaceae bacterium]
MLKPSKRSMRARFSLLAGSALLAGCGSGGDGPIIGPPPPPVVKAGTAVVSLSSTGGTVGAMRVLVVGAGVSLPAAKGTAAILTRRTLADTSTFVISTRGVANGDAVLEFKVANVEAPLAVTVVEATGGREQGYAAIASSAVTLSVVRQ